MEKLYDLYYCEFSGNSATPTDKVGGSRWVQMTHKEAITAKSKFSNPNKIMLVEVNPEETC